MLIEKNLVSSKQGRYLVFNNGLKEIRFDLADNKFKRVLCSGELKEVADTGVSCFFRGIERDTVAASFKDDRVYGEIIQRLLRRESYRQNANFATIFERVGKYMHLESYLLLGIRVDDSVRFESKIYTKSVLTFMRESGFNFSGTWENFYKSNEKLMTDCCDYLLKNYHDNLQVYQHFFDVVTHGYGAAPRFALLTKPLDHVEAEAYRCRGENGFNAEYKALLDYIIRCIAVEAMKAVDVIDEYYDYLSMARKIKQLKHIAKLREQGDVRTRLEDVKMVDYQEIEKYPRGLTIRHRIVTRNYDVMRQTYDVIKFQSQVNPDYAWGDKEYCVVTAQKPEDIKNEGTELNHCVGSYIDSVLQGRTQICFMRKADTPERSLVTIEIRSRGIQQARGYGNREIDATERAWLEKYAKALNLSFGAVKSDESLPCPMVKAKKVEGEVVTLPSSEELVNVA